jgi:hypothetical protein
MPTSKKNKMLISVDGSGQPKAKKESFVGNFELSITKNLLNKKETISGSNRKSWETRMTFLFSLQYSLF